MITLIRQCDRLESRFRTLCRKINSKARVYGRQRQELLQKSTTVYILEVKVVTLKEAIEGKEVANEEAQRFREMAEGLMYEVDRITEQLQTFTAQLENRGQTVDKVKYMTCIH